MAGHDREAAAERLRRFIGRRDGHEQALADVALLERLPDLMGTAAVAEALGTTTANLRKWRGVPAPLYDLPAGRFYDAAAIAAYKAERDRERVAA